MMNLSTAAAETTGATAAGPSPGAQLIPKRRPGLPWTRVATLFLLSLTLSSFALSAVLVVPFSHMPSTPVASSITALHQGPVAAPVLSAKSAGASALTRTSAPLVPALSGQGPEVAHSGPVANWTNLSGLQSSLGAPSVFGAAAASVPGWNPLGTYAVMFGGASCTPTSCAGGAVPSNTTYYQNGTGWHVLRSTAPTAPSARVNASMVYDSNLGALVLFGGSGTGGTLLNDTWFMSNASGNWWPALAPHAPSPRQGAAMAYDAAMGGVVLFGGQSAGGVEDSDTWLLTNTSGPHWTLLTTNGPEAGHAASAASFNNEMVLFGGERTSGYPAVFSDTWTFGTYWTNLTATLPNPPTARWGASFLDDPVLNHLVLFSGCAVAGSWPCSAGLSDTWMFNLSGWLPVTTAVSPAARVLASSLATPSSSNASLVGGLEVSSLRTLSDTWTFPSTYNGLALSATSNVSGGKPPLAVQFTSSVSGGMSPYTYAWTFGDGGTSALASPAHVYTSLGSYSVGIRACDAVGSCVSTALSITVTSTGGALWANATVTPTSGSVPFTVQLSSQVAWGTPPYQFSWRVYNSSSNYTTQLTTQNASLPLLQAGWYNVTFLVVDAGGDRYAISGWTIDALATGGMAGSLSLSGSNGTAPDTVGFQVHVWGGNLSEQCPPCVWGYTYRFAPGDGNVLTGFQPSWWNTSYTYSGAGSYSGSIQVTDVQGHTFTLTFTVLVRSGTGGPAISMSYSPSSGYAPLQVVFSASAYGGLGPYTFTLTTGTGAVVGFVPTNGTVVTNVTYTSAGTYAPAFSVSDANGATATSTGSILVYSGGSGGPLSVTLNATPLSGVAPLNVQFTGSASGGSAPYSYTWNFGDGALAGSSSGTVSHNYLAAGSYHPTLTVSDPQGNSSTATVTVTVYANGSAPLALSLSASPMGGGAPLDVSFSAVPSGGLPPYSFTWAFGDGNGVAGGPSSVSHVYTTPAQYTATVYVYDSRGATAERSVSITVMNGTSTPPAGVHPGATAGELVDASVALAALVVLGAVVVVWGRVSGRRRFSQLAESSGYSPSGASSGSPRPLGAQGGNGSVGGSGGASGGGGEAPWGGLEPYDAYRVTSPYPGAWDARGAPAAAGPEASPGANAPAGGRAGAPRRDDLGLSGML